MCVFPEFHMLIIGTQRRSAITPSKDIFRTANIDFLNPQGISFPMMYNINCPLFDTDMAQSHGLYIFMEFHE